ncbi:2-dehydropantoate 2-reductase [Glonium stellatum]|uniref:2-dehydropantoate 2-reductase n=1 Tax=Glonium stellatum TaxID=574774 RepID=A0A8E2FA80_9PEZI|nr:2-dehydropantoate 2-reductase [Glonium stellatum]
MWNQLQSIALRFPRLRLHKLLSLSAKTSFHLPCRDRRLSSTHASHDKKSIYILGVGSIGKLFAHSLAKSSSAPPVTLLLHRPELAVDCDKAGGCIEVVKNGSADKQCGFQTEVILQKGGDTSTHEIITNLIVVTKAQATVPALQPLKHRLTNESTILFLQNGLGVTEEVTARIFPNPSSRPQYLAGITTHGAYPTAPFSIVHAGIGTATVGAFLPPEDSGQQGIIVEDPVASIPANSRYLIQQILKAPALAATAVTPEQLLRARLEKLVINATVNPLTVIFNRHNGQLFGRPPIRVLIQRLLTEVSAVIRALINYKGNTMDSRFSEPALEKHVERVATFNSKGINSMLQDVRAGKETEIDYINGYIVARGAELGIQCPHNRKVVEMVKNGHVISESQISDFFPHIEGTEYH